jgi:transcriptional regulator with XRE-family HTH domain
MTTDAQALGKRLAEARRNAGLSQRTVAARIDIPRPSVSWIETGDRKVTAFELKAMADLYGVSVDWLLGSVAA